jgi:type I restriction enzyme S subunit
MNNWPYRQLSDFLIEREGRFKPNDPKIASYKRLEKIDFSGQIHISEKPSKTNMILIEPGDLVISGINVAKGALAVYEGNEAVTATIHYSSYTFDKNKINISFLKRFLKSPAFISELQEQVKGGIKTEIKPKHLLPLKARIPELLEQQKINHHFDAIENEISDLSDEIFAQSYYLTKLRQTILQEAIEGKITAGWRKANPVRKGDPDYDAEALLEKIKAEKEKLIKDGKIKKQKPLSPIKQEEVPFELPEGWVWTRLGEIVEEFQNGISKRGGGTGIKTIVLRLADITNYTINLNDTRHLSLDEKEQQKYLIYNNDILVTRVNGSVDIVGNFNLCKNIDKPIAYCDHLIRMRLFNREKQAAFVFLVEKTQLIRSRVLNEFKTTSGQKTINQGHLSNFFIPLPPLAEQQAIVEQVKKLLSMIDELEKQVSERKEQSEQLMQAVLREAFEGGKTLAKDAENAKEKTNA